MGANGKIDATARKALAALSLIDLDPSITVVIEVIDGSEQSTEKSASIAKSVPIFKTSEERYVLGIVLEPTLEMNEPDSQGDVYSAEDVRLAAYRYMEKFQVIGVQHKEKADARIKILESWIQREDSTIEGQVVKAGTWLMGLRIVDDDLWSKVKEGSFTGLSIGGVANSKPVD